MLPISAYHTCHQHVHTHSHPWRNGRTTALRSPRFPAGDEVKAKPWLKKVLTPPPGAQDPTPHPTRRRPLIYVYDVSPEFGTDILQYRIERSHCLYREFVHGNRSEYVHYNAYGSESVGETGSG